MRLKFKEINKKIFALILKWLSLWLSLFMFAVLPMMASWLENRDKTAAVDLILPFILSFILSLVISAVFFRSFNKNRLAGLIGGILAVLFLGQDNNGVLFKIAGKSDDYYEGYFVVGFFLLIVILVCVITFLIHKYTKKWRSKTLLYKKIGIILFPIFFLVLLYSFTKVLFVKWPLFFHFLDKGKDYHEGGFVLGFFLVAVVFSGIIYYLIHKLTNKWRPATEVVANIIIITLATAFFILSYSLAKDIIIEWPQFFYRPPDISESLALDSAGARPDIYYIVLDRYANSNVLKSQFNFDNSDFTNFLEINGFLVNPDAYSNYPYTAMSMASTLNISYNTDLVSKFASVSAQTTDAYHQAIRYASVIRQLKSLGYTYYHLGTWYEATNKAPLADYTYQDDGQLTLFNHTYTLNQFSKREFMRSYIWKFIQRGFKVGGYQVYAYRGQEQLGDILSKINLLKNMADGPAGGRFIFAHILVPHDPFYFKADGSFSPDTGIDDKGKPVKQKYTDQVQFINSQMKDIINRIEQNSQNQAVIILQSDEGPYSKHFDGKYIDSSAVNNQLAVGDMRRWTASNLKMKYGILAAYQVPKAGEVDLAAGADAVNIFRLVFNTYFGGNLPYLPACYYAFPDGRFEPYVYTEIGERLTGQANPACTSDSR